ncbi:MAG: transglycosylase SLT domain-containing protein, partial [Deltaproteobacteria bacterium]|nr:transglycosylase SLT domain-containing protein [Deltaproteobacteria bacterium]
HKDDNGNKATAVETAIAKRPIENKLWMPFYKDEIISDEKFINLENVAQQMIDRVLVLCQMSQEYWQRGELDRAIELLDQAYLLTMRINTYAGENLSQQKDDMRYTISKRILEIYASRKIIINGSQNEIPVIINKQVQSEIDLYTKGKLRKHFIKSYKRSGKYRQMIVDMLKEEDLPQELSWLPLIESGFRAKILSKSRALGLWQFIPSTGYKFGLNRNRYIDERMDPEKSTRAAIAYLKELHGHFGDWSTVLAAYNCGENQVLRVIRNQKINYLDNFWDLYKQLPQETSRYVPKFLATLHIVKNLEKYGLDKVTINKTLKSESLTVTKKIHLKKVAKITGIDKKSLEGLNPELRRNIVPGGNYSLKLPKGNKQRLLANIDQILHLNPAYVKFIKHRVQSGESLSLIARRYRTSVTKIMLANNLHRADYIVTGNTLKIPHKMKTSKQR